MQIFISHISEEKPLALAMKDGLESSFPGQIKVFVSSDPDDIPAGTKWLNKIGDALKDSTLLIILYSPQSTLRPWINFEAGCGWIKDIPIMPICHSGLKVSQIGAPISSFQGLEIESNDFSKRFFGDIAKHAGLPNISRLVTKKFRAEIKTAIGDIEPLKFIENTPIKENAEFSEKQIQIMQSLAKSKDARSDDVGKELLATRLSLSITLLEHHIQPLIDKGFVKCTEIMSMNRYSIDHTGISYLVNKGLHK